MQYQPHTRCVFSLQSLVQHSTDCSVTDPGPHRTWPRPAAPVGPHQDPYCPFHIRDKTGPKEALQAPPVRAGDCLFAYGQSKAVDLSTCFLKQGLRSAP